MSEKVEIYKSTLQKVLAPETEGNTLSDAEADACFDRIDELWSAMDEAERAEITAWRETLGTTTKESA